MYDRRAHRRARGACAIFSFVVLASCGASDILVTEPEKEEVRPGDDKPPADTLPGGPPDTLPGGPPDTLPGEPPDTLPGEPSDTLPGGPADTLPEGPQDPTQPPTIFFVEGFEDGDLAARGWFANTGLTITSADAYSGSSSLEISFRQGASSPEHGTASRIQFPESETVYLSYRVKYSDNWVGSGRPYHPHEIQLLTNADDRWVGPAVTHLTTYVEHRYVNGGLAPRLGMQDAANIDQSRIGVDLTGVTENRAAGGCNGEADGYPTGCYQSGGSYRNQKMWLGQTVALTDAQGPRYKNDWHHVEVYFELNSIVGGVGQADGVVRYWLDGALLLEVPGVLFRTGAHPTMAFWELVIGAYIGDGSPVDQKIWIDDLKVGDRRD